MFSKVISGGQTGADFAGLRAAKDFGIPTGGFAPKDWLTENGPAPWLADWGLIECAKPAEKTRDAVAGWIYRSICYAERTAANVTEADATIWFDWDEGDDKKGFECTRKVALKASKPIWIIRHCDKDRPPAATVAFLGQYWNFKPTEVLNVAGNRISKSPGIEVWVYDYLCEMFGLLGHRRSK